MNIILPNFIRSKILVIGDIMLDRYWYGSVERISPDAPVPIVKIESAKEQPGGAANVAVNVAKLGCQSKLIGVTGKDNDSDVLYKELNRHKVICNFIKSHNYSTIVKLRVISQNHKMIRIDFEKTFNVDPIFLIDYIKPMLIDTEIIILSDYAKGTLSNVQEIIKIANNFKIPVLVDPKGSDFSKYYGATLLKPNLSEFELVVGYCENEEILVNRGMEIIKEYKISSLLITRSELGMILLQYKKDPINFPTQATKIYDVNGAGDIVISVLAVSLSSGYGIEESCFFANVAAGISVGKATSSITFDELKNSLYRKKNINFEVIT